MKTKKRAIVSLPPDAAPVEGREGLYQTPSGESFTTIHIYKEGKLCHLPKGKGIRVDDPTESAKGEAEPPFKRIKGLPEDAVAVPGRAGLYVTPSGKFFGAEADPDGGKSSYRASPIPVKYVDGRNNTWMIYNGAIHGNAAYAKAFPESTHEERVKVWNDLAHERWLESLKRWK